MNVYLKSTVDPLMQHLIALITLAIAVSFSSSKQKDICAKYGDNYGVWKSVKEVMNSADSINEFESHFIGGNSSGATKFNKVWIPNNCSNHRFTNSTLNQCIDFRTYQNYQADWKYLS